jgi:hypothetical protein
LKCEEIVRTSLAGDVWNDHLSYVGGDFHVSNPHVFRRDELWLRRNAKLMPTVLRELMRHIDISTTMKYYVGQNAESTADAVWAAQGNSSGNTNRPTTPENAKTSGDDRNRTSAIFPDADADSGTSAANSGAVSRDSSPADPDLAKLIAAWPNLPAAVWSEIMAAIRGQPST